MSGDHDCRALRLDARGRCILAGYRARGYDPERLYLFGSHARGEAGPDSDYDLLVVVPDSAPPERRESRLAYQALRGTGTATDVIVVTRDYFEWMLGAAASLPATVEREGRLLYTA